MAVTVNGDSIDDVVSLSVSPGIALDPVKDHLGTIHAWVNSATGAIEQKMEYTAYGETTIAQSSPALAALGMQRAFTGREYDMDTELQHNRARFYDPQTGRFLSEDPIGFKGRDTNFYRYVFNNPIIHTDPSGKIAPILIIGGIIIGFFLPPDITDDDQTDITPADINPNWTPEMKQENLDKANEYF